MTVKRDDQEQDIPVYNVNQDDIETPSNQGTTNNDNGPVMAEAVPVQSQPEVPVTTPTPNTVDVIAPTNMAGGYQFNVDAGGRLLRVAVPAGGVQAGQRFGAIILQQGGAGTGSPQDDPHMIPRGHWRDGLCDCCKFGCCHAQCCLAFWVSFASIQRKSVYYDLCNPVSLFLFLQWKKKHSNVIDFVVSFSAHHVPWGKS